MKINETRESFDDILCREKVWREHAYGWQGRLQVALGSLSGEYPWQSSAESRKFAEVNTTLLICELAILNYQDDHHQPPDSLDQLVTNYLPSVPMDPFSGRAIVYRRTSDGYVLYSVAEDGKDDGGVDFPTEDTFYRYDIRIDEQPDLFTVPDATTDG